ncbi:MAG: hypothetical protein IT371_23130 [Deltaproteobacteria bacterium]|nr:hypothetical protein [Deltaproteobacteria bacterium]
MGSAAWLPGCGQETGQGSGPVDWAAKQAVMSDSKADMTNEQCASYGYSKPGVGCYTENSATCWYNDKKGRNYLMACQYQGGSLKWVAYRDVSDWCAGDDTIVRCTAPAKCELYAAGQGTCKAPAYYTTPSTTSPTTPTTTPIYDQPGKACQAGQAVLWFNQMNGKTYTLTCLQYGSTWKWTAHRKQDEWCAGNTSIVRCESGQTCQMISATDGNCKALPAWVNKSCGQLSREQGWKGAICEQNYRGANDGAYGACRGKGPSTRNYNWSECDHCCSSELEALGPTTPVQPAPLPAANAWCGTISLETCKALPSTHRCAYYSNVNLCLPRGTDGNQVWHCATIDVTQPGVGINACSGQCAFFWCKERCLPQGQYFPAGADPIKDVCGL